jgi:hypothetical protein
MTNEVYDRNFFVRFFEAIPTERWTQHTLVNMQGQRCAMGHIRSHAGWHSTLETPTGHTLNRLEHALGSLFDPLAPLEGVRQLVLINDTAPARDPRSAVLAALKALPVYAPAPILSVAVTDPKPDFAPDAPGMEDYAYKTPVFTEADFKKAFDLVFNQLPAPQLKSMALAMQGGLGNG